MGIEERSTVRSRQLGDALRSAMDNAKLTGKRTACLLGWSESRISRFFTGKLPATEIEVSALLALYGVTGAERDRLLELTRHPTTLGWTSAEAVRTLADHQRKATRITEVHTATVPLLLQTENYARAVVSRMVNAPTEGTEHFLTDRLARQQLFAIAHPPQCIFYIHELVLQLPVGGSRVMSEQLHHLLRLSVRSYITIRLIPSAVGAHAGLAGSCALLEFSDVPPVTYVETETASYFIEEPAEITAYHNVFTALTAVALDQTQTKTIISRLAAEQSGSARAG
ncbi:MAG TPA: helix-turn-helix transcriptional regulator [Pseudonocardiaceae bacterium]|jgi:transcriptional regulator with XRE-family HTH domain|nr:helix-turn-helix transcriptional regulator [Pseudonocardiaceae bacterium]